MPDLHEWKKSTPPQSLRAISIDAELLKSCIHCGLCLPACPTYLVSGKETESPRGRIHLLSKASSGELPLNDRLKEHLDSCLGCLGCQTACPSGVQYEEILNQARPVLAEMKSEPSRSMLRFVFSYLLPSYWLLRILGYALRLWQKLFGARALSAYYKNEIEGLEQRAMPSDPLLRLALWEQFVPKVPSHLRLPTKIAPSSSKQSSSALHAMLFSGCIMDIFYNHVNHAAVKLMLKQGHSVETPEQTCCGALAFHAGESDIAIRLARRNIDSFEKQGSDDPIVVTAAGCGAMLKHYGKLLDKDPHYAHRAEKFAARVVDLSELLANHDFLTAPLKMLDETTTYHAACHLAHAQGVREEPVALLNRLDKDSRLELLEDCEHCCGSAGIYNLLNTKMSLAVLDKKMDNIERTGAEIIVTTNPGCMLQLQAGLSARGMKAEVLHLAELLDRHYE